MIDQPSPAVLRTLLAPLLASLLLATVAAPAAAASQPEKGDAVLSGRVVDTQGNTVAGATVVAVSKVDPTRQAETRSGGEGKFEMVVSDPDGEWTVRAEAEGLQPFEAAVTLVADQRTDIEFRLVDLATAGLRKAVAAYNRGVEAYGRDDREAAEAAFRQALELDPEMAQPQQGLAALYHAQGRLEEAAAAIDAFLATPGTEGGEPPVAGLFLAYTIHRELGHAERAEELTEALADTEKAKPLAVHVYNDAVTVLQAGDEEGALARFARARGLDPELVPAYTSAATLLYNRERYPEVEALLARVAELAPDDPRGLRVRYLLHDARGETEAAAAAIEAYAAVDAAGAADALTRRGEVDFDAGELETAIAALERALELAPDTARAHYILGLGYLGSDVAKARRHLERFLELAPEDPDAATAREVLAAS